MSWPFAPSTIAASPIIDVDSLEFETVAPTPTIVSRNSDPCTELLAPIETFGPTVDAASGTFQVVVQVRRDPALPEPTFDDRSIRDDLPVNGVYRGGSDHRKDGQAAGW